MTGGHPSLHEGELLVWIDDRDSSYFPWLGHIQFKAREPFVEIPEFPTVNSGRLGRNDLTDLLGRNGAKELRQNPEIDALPLECEFYVSSQGIVGTMSGSQEQPRLRRNRMMPGGNGSQFGWQR